MKFRNILLTTFAASAFVIGTTSCSDSFLDEKMYSSYGPEVSDVNYGAQNEAYKTIY